MIRDNRSTDMKIHIIRGRPILEPIACHGPFVTDRRHELIQAIEDSSVVKIEIFPVEENISV